jgi:glycogen debranching enzyme
MLTAGDECGRTQHGNNNAYCQFIPIDWTGRDLALENDVAALSAQRTRHLACFTRFPEGGRWLSLGGDPMTVDAWESLATDGVIHQPPTEAPCPVLSVQRSTRRFSAAGLNGVAACMSAFRKRT